MSKQKLSPQGKRLINIARKNAKRHGITIKIARGWGIERDYDNNSTYVSRREDKCCCVLGACLVNKPGLSGFIGTLVKRYGANEDYYYGVTKGFDGFTNTNEFYLQVKDLKSAKQGLIDGQIMAQRLVKS